MGAFVLDVSMRERFFDRAKVVKWIENKERRALSRMGAFIRQRARTDVLRRGKRSAANGEPPRVHSNDSHATLKNIIFALGSDGQSVAVGVVGIPSLRLVGSTARTVPELLEEGGTARRSVARLPDGRVVFGRLAERPDAVPMAQVVRYRGNPFMKVALAREARAGTLAQAFSYG